MFIINIILSFTLISSIPVSATTVNTENFEFTRIPQKSNYSYIHSYDYYRNVSLPKIQEIKEKKLAEQLLIEKQIQEKQQQEDKQARIIQEALVKKQEKSRLSKLIKTTSRPSQPKPTNYQGGDIGTYIIQKCGQYGCNSDQLMRVMYCESGGRPNARNGQYLGLFQFHPKTFSANASRIGLGYADIWNPYHQIEVATWMFSIGQAGQWSCK